MVQQESLINKLKTNLPKNLILVAPRYFGKKTLVSEITDISYVYVDHKIDAIREIDLDGNYIFTDIDDWNVSSYSALLKHLEEGTGIILLLVEIYLIYPNPFIQDVLLNH